MHQIDPRWLALLQKEISESSTVESITYVDNDKLIYRPYINNRCSEGSITKLSSSWSVCSKIQGKSLNQNKLALSALSNGAEALMFTLCTDITAQHVLKDIRLDYITTIFDARNISQVELNDFMSYLKSHYPNKALDIGLNKKPSQYFPLICSLVIEENNDLVLNEKMAALCRSYIDAGDQDMIVHIKSSNLFFQDICRIRAYRILFANIDTQLGRKSSYRIMTQLGDESFGQPLEGISLVKQSYKCLSAALGGSDIIVGQEWDEDSSTWSRLSQNIQHIMKHESHLDHFSDATAGSYFFEDLTQQIVKQTFDII